jgi:hypothetical protein
VIESAKARAIFSAQDGGRWNEFTWKDGNLNFVPDRGVFAGGGPVTARENGGTLEFSGKGWTRTVKLVEGVLTIEQSTTLPPDPLKPGKRDNVTLTIDRPSATTGVYTLQ